MTHDQSETAISAGTPAGNLGDLLAEFGDEFEIVKEDDGNLSARRRHPRIHWRATGPVIARAATPAALRKLLVDAERPGTACNCHACGVSLDAIVRVIGSGLHEAGLDIREVRYQDQTIELIVTNPGAPSRGRLILDRSGVAEWDHWCSTSDAANGDRLIAVIMAALGSATQTPAAPQPGNRPHP